jgi:hypothetical protein
VEIEASEEMITLSRRETIRAHEADRRLARAARIRPVLGGFLAVVGLITLAAFRTELTTAIGIMGFGLTITGISILTVSIRYRPRNPASEFSQIRTAQLRLNPIPPSAHPEIYMFFMAGCTALLAGVMILVGKAGSIATQYSGSAGTLFLLACGITLVCLAVTKYALSMRMAPPAYLITRKSLSIVPNSELQTSNKAVPWSELKGVHLDPQDRLELEFEDPIGLIRIDPAVYGVSILELINHIGLSSR